MDAEGAPVEGATVDVWHASPVGFYENQDAEQAEYNLRGVFRTDNEGRYCVPLGEAGGVSGAGGWAGGGDAAGDGAASVSAGAFPFHGDASGVPDADYAGVSGR